MSRIFPRFSSSTESELLDQLELDVRNGRPPSTLHPHGDHPRREYGATGGDRISAPEMLQIREAVLSRTEALGPEASVRQHDTAITQGLMETLSLDRGQLAQRGVWSYISIVLMPDVVLDRFGTGRFPRNRFKQGKQNTFSRLYLRGWILGDLITDDGIELLEDELVQLTERNMSTDVRLARALARAAWERSDQGQRRDFSRELFIEAGRESAVTDLALLSDAELESAVKDMVDSVVQRLR
ncbi:hypothetical protein [Brachybacterium muris]|uniref:Uncharacterized protein n=1 Tax=Brachybacterium muris UCD-AY4 TaxID=1249481 RepID=A0A022KT99_9MICO|nr:hypothetical protein [Brachybacterium muris]EYT49025.1 hypothetical protein D641_0109710 [Brachybacterium muris UCD-AY4]